MKGKKNNKASNIIKFKQPRRANIEGLHCAYLQNVPSTHPKERVRQLMNNRRGEGKNVLAAVGKMQITSDIRDSEAGKARNDFQTRPNHRDQPYQPFRNRENSVCSNSESRKNIFKKHYLQLMQNKYEKILKPHDTSNTSIDEERFMKFLCEEDGYTSKESGKHSQSFLSVAPQDKTRDVSRQKPTKYSSIKSRSPEPSGEDEDDVERLGKLSVINAGARFELLEANQMLLDLNLGLNRLQRKNNSALRLNENFLDTRTMFNGIDKFVNPVTLLKGKASRK